MNEDLQFPYNFAIKGNKDYFVSMKLHKLFKDLGAVNLDSENPMDFFTASAKYYYLGVDNKVYSAFRYDDVVMKRIAFADRGEYFEFKRRNLL